MKKIITLIFLMNFLTGSAIASGGGGTIITDIRQDLRILVMREHGARLYIPYEDFVLLSKIDEGSCLSLQTGNLGQRRGQKLRVDAYRILVLFEDGTGVYVLPTY